MWERLREDRICEWLVCAALLAACSSGGSDDDDKSSAATGSGGSGSAGMLGSAAGSGGASVHVGSGGASSPSAGSGGAPASNNGSGGTPAIAATGGTGAAGMMMVAGTGGATGSGGATAPMAGISPKPDPDPQDGDASKPIVATTDVACGGPTGGFGLGQPNFKVDDRDVIVTYPCNKHAGAPVTFILNLHGTTPVEQHFYQYGYFSAHQFAASHNLIVVEPSSVVEQWGNGDDGKDEPYLMDVIDWVYKNLGGDGKFDIRAMWVGGHSWGGGYTATFGCKPELADKVQGLIMMSGGGIKGAGFGGAACSDKVSVIMSTAEGDMRMPADQSMLAASHGCGPTQTEMILATNVHTFWADCNPGFVHANYYMMGKQHADFMDKEVVESIVDWIKIARQ